jgi:hypothetical protein
MIPLFLSQAQRQALSPVATHELRGFFASFPANALAKDLQNSSIAGKFSLAHGL